ncbi:MAG: YraN family protein [Candidatus Kerfeldbacteria bacterium]|nr:YraN family protein [Candidatus Kerfeldbacteria bacterium]
MPPFSHRQRTGRAGERLAREHLEAKGYRVIAENFTCREGELDLVCLHRRELVFVEVKYRQSNRFGTALESITHAKLRRLQAAAAVFRQRNRIHRSYRFEVVAIDATEVGVRLEHLTEL